MATRTKKTSKRAKSGRTPNGNGAHPNRANGNGAHANGNGAHANGTNGNGNGSNGNGGVATADARRVATEMGSAVLVASRLETARHSDDVELIAGAICEHLGLPAADREDIVAGARLHDIGKASIPRDLLDKPGALSPSEWEVMRTHTEVGQQILGSVPELKQIGRLVRHSHERWDGGGYPDGLEGDDIPLGSRIIFCADAFHAIRSDRAYRKGVPAAQALGEIRRCAGTQFDPEVVAAFEQVIRDLRLTPRAKRRAQRSSRLSALLLCLALGGGGSAIATSNLLGEPDAESPAPPPVVLECGSLYCYSMTPTMLASAGHAHFAGPLGEVLDPTSPSATSPGAAPLGATPTFSDPAVVQSGPVDGDSPGGGQVVTGEERGAGPGETGGSSSSQPPGSGSSGGSGSTGTSSKDKNPNANGNGWAFGHDKQGHGNGGGNGDSGDSGDSGPSIPDVDVDVGSGIGSGSSGSGSPGNSGSAPGHLKPPKAPKL